VYHLLICLADIMPGHLFSLEKWGLLTHYIMKGNLSGEETLKQNGF
jgi:hypothetical protein